jgi:glycosyltransferase involved in cell wall biosynthesis
MPKLSIITINYNNCEGLQKTIQSVFGQTFKNYEYIIIDGGSTDGSTEIIKNLTDDLAYWVSEPDKGIYNAMNKGIVQAKGEYLQFLNSGDFFIDEHTLSCVFSIERSADIVYGDISYIFKDGSKKRYPALKPEELLLRNFFTNERATIFHPAAFIKKKLFDGELYDETYALIADNKFFIKQIVVNNCSADYTGMIIADFDTNGVSSQRANWPKTIEERNRIMVELIPPRILKDYQLFLPISGSPLLQYMPVLNKTTGFHKLVGTIVGIMAKVYKIIKPVR